MFENSEDEDEEILINDSIQEHEQTLKGCNGRGASYLFHRTFKLLFDQFVGDSSDFAGMVDWLGALREDNFKHTSYHPIFSCATWCLEWSNGSTRVSKIEWSPRNFCPYSFFPTTFCKPPSSKPSGLCKILEGSRAQELDFQTVKSIISLEVATLKGGISSMLLVFSSGFCVGLQWMNGMKLLEVCNSC